VGTVARVFKVVLLHPTRTREAMVRDRTGWWAWLLQRVTGVLLVGYLFLHIAVISSAQHGSAAFDALLRFVQQPAFVVLDMVLIAIVLYHTLNGTRLILFDLGIGLKQQAALFWICVALTVLGTALSVYLSRPLIFR
jgi:succinate dehydrogenase / fumarate reductase cytochrome b subunit